MRFDRLRVANVGPFTDVDVDFREMPGPIIGVTGDNGAGKSTLVGLSPASLHGVFPHGARLSAWATAPRSIVESWTCDLAGRPVRILHTMSGTTGSGHVAVFDEADEPILKKCGRKEFGVWAKKNLPPRDVLLNSTFSQQGGFGFIALGERDRKAVLLRVLGIERLERLSALANKRASALQREVEKTEARVDEVSRGSVDIEVLRKSVEVAGADRTLAAEASNAAQAALDAGRRERQAALDQREARSAARGEIKRANLAVIAAQSAVAGARKSLDICKGALVDADAIAERFAEFQAARKAQNAAQAEALAAASRVDAATAEFGQAQAERSAALGAEAATIRDIERVRVGVCAEAEKIEASHGALVVAREVYDVAHGRAAKQLAELEELRAARLTRFGDSRKRLRDGLVDIREKPAGNDFDPAEHAGETLDLDAHDFDRVGDEVVDAAKARLDELNAQRKEAVLDVERLQILAGRQGELDEAEARRTSLERELGMRKADVMAATEKANAAAVRSDEAENERNALASVALEAIAAVERFAGAEDNQREVEAARERLPLLEQAVESGDKRVEDATFARAALPEAEPEGVDVPEVFHLESEFQDRSDALRAAGRRFAQAEAEVERAQKDEARIDALRRERDMTLQRSAVARRLAQDLGRDGLQGLEVDAAGPEVSEWANRLLHECFGPRYTVELRTTRDTGRGATARTIEACQVWLTDQGSDDERGYAGPVEGASFGQKAVIAEAVSSALAIVACKAWGIESPTIIRDEADAPLSVGNSRAWIAMLRSTLAIVGAHRALVVTHNPEVVAACDSLIHVAGGSARPAT